MHTHIRNMLGRGIDALRVTVAGLPISASRSLRAILPVPLILCLAFRSCSPTIIELIPSSGRVRVGDTLTVIGTNFGFSSGSHRVSVDGLRINSFKPGSSDTKLVFDIPLSIPDVPQQGRAAILMVSNGSSSLQRILLLEPATAPMGSVEVIAQGVLPPNAVIQPMSAYDFAFSLSSRVNVDATFAIGARVNVASGQASWQNSLQILDRNRNPLPYGQITVSAGQSEPFLVRITIPPATTGTQFSVQVTATPGGIAGSTATISETVGTVARPAE